MAIKAPPAINWLDSSLPGAKIAPATPTRIERMLIEKAKPARMVLNRVMVLVFIGSLLIQQYKDTTFSVACQVVSKIFFQAGHRRTAQPVLQKNNQKSNTCGENTTSIFQLCAIKNPAIKQAFRRKYL